MLELNGMGCPHVGHDVLNSGKVRLNILHHK